MNKQLKRFWKRVAKFGHRARQGWRRWDPVCGMEATANFFSSTYRGIQYFFCSAYCQLEFEAHPTRYLR